MSADESTGIDRKRAFWCVSCKQKGQPGIVCPIGPTGLGLRAVLRDSPGLTAAVQSGKSNAHGNNKPRKGGKSKNKNKKSPLKASFRMTAAEDEGDDDGDDEGERDIGKPLNLSGLDTAKLADALERVHLTWTQCSTCGTLPTANYIKKCIAREEHYRQNPPETYEEVLEAGSEKDGFLHESHYLLFQALDIITHDMTNQARRLSTLSGSKDEGSGKKTSKGKANNTFKGDAGLKHQQNLFAPALSAMQHCVRLLDQVLPLVHHEKVVYYDRLGQLAVCAGQSELAQGVFSAAYKLSVLASGASVPQSRQLLALVERPPLTLEELMRHYTKSSESEADEGM